MIIEDEATIQKILSEPLTFTGYEITTASDGLEGINFFHTEDFDHILLDIMLPKINGYTVCEMIWQESQIPIEQNRESVKNLVSLESESF